MKEETGKAWNQGKNLFTPVFLRMHCGANREVLSGMADSEDRIPTQNLSSL